MIEALLALILIGQQPHPCDGDTPSQITARADVVEILSFCQPQKKAVDGSIVPVQGFVLTWNGTPLDIAIGTTPGANVAAPVGQPNADGEQEYRTTLFFGEGTHKLELAAYNVVNGQRQLSSPNPVITVTAVKEPPLVEICGNGIDDDKDGQVDENPPCEPPPPLVHKSTLGVAPSSVVAGAQVAVAWTCQAVCSPTDWIALFRQGTTDLLWSSVTSGAASGSFTAPIPSTAVAGNYEFRYCLAGSLTCPTVAGFTVTAPPPPLVELCGDGIDNDKDGLIDEDDPPCSPPPPCDLKLTVEAWPTKNRKTSARFTVIGAPADQVTVTFTFSGNRSVSATAAKKDGTCSVTVKR